jgi:HAD superfamily hydrolase (TIGR01549 family)
MTADRISGAMFDLDGTLYELPGRKLRLTLSMPGDIGMLKHIGKARKAMRDRRFPDREQLRAALWEELGRRAGVSPERARSWYLDRFMTKFVDLLRRKGRVRPGMVELLGRMQERGVKLAVVSDFGGVAERLEALRIPRQLFDDIVGAEDFGVLKPSPAPFSALAEKWGLVPSSLVVVGDRWDLDGASAEAAGMEFLGVVERGLLGRRKPAEGFFEWTYVAEQLERRTRHDVEHEN